MSNKTWINEEKKFLNAVQNIKIPNSLLNKVPCIRLNDVSDLMQIPLSGGCYWIWTNEPVKHSLHKKNNPKPFDGGEIIYNGIAKDNVRNRISNHLFGTVDAGWSAISLDIYSGSTVSHRKKALAGKGKVPYIKIESFAKRSNSKKGILIGSPIEIYKPIRTKEDLDHIYLTAKEKRIVSRLNNEIIYFRNGINIKESKHNKFAFRVYYITGLSSLYLDYIEKQWRVNYGLPKLCSYSAGR